MILSLVFALAAAPAALPPAMPLAEAAKGILRGAGTEPFWGLEISPAGIKLTEPGDDGDKVTEFKTEYSTQPSPDLHIWTSGPLTVTISAGVCSDGMSDIAYPYTLEAVIAAKEMRTLKGCAYRPWGQDILTALPVIDACLKVAKDNPPVVYAIASGEDAGYALLPGADDKPMDGCTVAAGKASIAPVSDAALPPGAQQEIFVRGPGKNPGGECYEAPEVKDAEGKVIGWWLDPAGC